MIDDIKNEGGERQMKERIAGFFRKLWKEETGASHIVEIIVVIVVVIALAGILLTRLTTAVNSTGDKLDSMISNPSSITVEVPDVI